MAFASGVPFKPSTASRRLRWGQAGQAEADEERAAALEQVAARKAEFGGAHRASPAMAREASWIAFMIRG